MFGWSKPSLDVESLGLDGKDRDVARIIAEETERKRAALISALPPLPPEVASAQAEPRGLLVQQTVEEERLSRLMRKPWDELFRTGEVLLPCAGRAGLDLASLLQFVREKCNPPNWEAQLWYEQWILEALSEKVPADQVGKLLAAKHEEAAVLERKRQATKGAIKRAAKYEEAEQWVQDQWRKEGSHWDSKKKFAEAFCELVQSEFGLSISASTISDVWLSPARLAGK